MIVGITIFELHLPTGRSLKQKRRVVKSVIDRIHHRFKVSIAESDFHDLHQRAEITIAAVHRSQSEMDRMMDAIHRLLDDLPDAILTSWDLQYVEGHA